MAIERENAASEMPEQNERLLPEQKLLLAGPDFLTSFGFTEKINKVLRTKKDFDRNVFMSLLKEYVSIYELLTELVGKENTIVAKTEFTFGKNSPAGPQFQSVSLPAELSFGSVEIPSLTKQYKAWPRDAHTLLNGKILTNPKAWNLQDESIKPSSLGEGGKVLVKGKAILVTPDIWKTSKDEILQLIMEGFRVGWLPFVKPEKQKYDFMEGHIDGHAALIEDENGQLALVVADSYSHQGNHTRRLIREAAETIGAEMKEVYDYNLPPLALNLVQFEDRSIAVTNSEARDLEVTLIALVGKDRVFTTEVPLIKIPELTCGGIRCLTNIIPHNLPY